MGIETIDRRVRDKAAKELRSFLEKAFKPAFDAAKAGYNHDPTVLRSEQGVCGKTGEKTISIKQALQAALESAYEAQLPQYKENAVAEFLQKIDSLQDQLDELRS